MAHAFSLHLEGRQNLCEFKTSLVYRASTRHVSFPTAFFFGGGSFLPLPAPFSMKLFCILLTSLIELLPLQIFWAFFVVVVIFDVFITSFNSTALSMCGFSISLCYLLFFYSVYLSLRTVII